MTPYAYTLDRCHDCFQTLEKAVRILSHEWPNPYPLLYRSPVTAHYPDGTSDNVSIEDYVEEMPVDIASVKAELDAAITLSRERYEQEYPTPEDKAYDLSHRYSGCSWLHEHDPAEMIQRKVESLKWKWKDHLLQS